MKHHLTSTETLVEVCERCGLWSIFTTDCPGQMIPLAGSHAIYMGRINFRSGQWHYEQSLDARERNLRRLRSGLHLIREVGTAFGIYNINLFFWDDRVSTYIIAGDTHLGGYSVGIDQIIKELREC